MSTEPKMSRNGSELCANCYDPKARHMVTDKGLQCRMYGNFYFTRELAASEVPVAIEWPKPWIKYPTDNEAETAWANGYNQCLNECKKAAKDAANSISTRSFGGSHD